MGALSNLANSAKSFNPVAAVGGAVLDHTLNSYAARKAYKRNKTMYKNRHQWEVEDLRKAGLNPIMSAMKGAPVGAAAPQASTKGGVGSSAISNALNTAQMDQIKATTRNIEQGINIKKPVEDAALAVGTASEDAKTMGIEGYNSAKQVLIEALKPQNPPGKASPKRKAWREDRKAAEKLRIRKEREQKYKRRMK